MNTDNENLKPLRDQIDRIDSELLRLLNERAGCAIEIGRIKSEQSGHQGETTFYRPERVAQVLDRLKEENSGPLASEDLSVIFREVMSCCLSLEQVVKVSYLGPRGTFSEAAALKQFGQSVDALPFQSIDEVFRAVESCSVDFGVVPVENSTEGMVNLTLDCFVKSGLQICAEIEMPIHQCLLRRPGAKGKINEILSHPQSLAQCRLWLDSNYREVPRRSVASNAEAARLAGENGNVVAVGGEIAANQYGLSIEATNIEDNPTNKTRFLVIGRQLPGISGNDKTSILVSVKNKPGALYGVLEPFRDMEIGLSRIETRPSGTGDWSYLFFIDFDGHVLETKIKKVLSTVGELALNLKVLGSYPKVG